MKDLRMIRVGESGAGAWCLDPMLLAKQTDWREMAIARVSRVVLGPKRNRPGPAGITAKSQMYFYSKIV
jgi:hypothetical protein